MWLLSLDSSGTLQQYRQLLDEFFDTEEQVFLAYSTFGLESDKEAAFDAQGFFEEVGVVDEAHQRTFTRWFEARLQGLGKDLRTPPDAPPEVCAVVGPLTGSAKAKAKVSSTRGAGIESPEVAQPAASRSGSTNGHREAPESSPLAQARSLHGERRVDRSATAASGDDAQQAGSKAAENTSQDPRAAAGAEGAAASAPCSDAGGALRPTDDLAAVAAAASGAQASGATAAASRAAASSVALEGDAKAGQPVGSPPAERAPDDTSEQHVDGSAAPSRSVSPAGDDEDDAGRHAPAAGPSSASESSARGGAAPPCEEGVEEPPTASKAHGPAAPSTELVERLRRVREAAVSLPAADTRPHATIALLGHTGAGKTALLGALLRAAGAWDAHALEKFVKEQRQSESGSAAPSSAGETRVECCAAESRRFTFLDPAGHRGGVAQAWAAAVQADLVVLVASARKAELATGMAKGGLTCEHAALARAAGLESLVVAVNKMDDTQSDKEWSSTGFEDARSRLLSALRGAGLHYDQVSFVPVAASTGANVGTLDTSCASWYAGESLLDMLKDATLPTHPDSCGPPRVLVTGLEKRGGAAFACGRVERGEIQAGMPLRTLPRGSECGVLSIEVDGQEVSGARAGELVCLRVSGSQLHTGDVLCGFDEAVRVVAKFRTQLRLVDAAGETPVLTPGFRCMLHLHQATEECEVAKLIEVLDPRTKKKETCPKFARAPMLVLCVITLCSGREVATEAGTGRMSRLTLRQNGGTIAVGRVTELPRER